MEVENPGPQTDRHGTGADLWERKGDHHPLSKGKTCEWSGGINLKEKAGFHVYEGKTIKKGVTRNA